jgi:alpha-glucosidase
MVFSSTIHLEPSLIFCHERRNVTSLVRRRRNELLFHLWPQMEDVVTSYTDLTGKPELPPLWALGYHQCKWSYYPESNVKEIRQFKIKHAMPFMILTKGLDVLHGTRNIFLIQKEWLQN